jgi:hypothetical protein
LTDREMGSVAQGQEYPAYLDALEHGEERTIRARLDELKSEMQALTRSLEHARRSKRVFYAGEQELEREVVRLLKEDLRLDARHGSANGDGFWLGDGAAHDWCIGEAKSSGGGNVAKEHIAQLMIRRAKAGRDEGTPALLVMNTFEGAHSLEERDQPVPPDVARRAVEDHVVVMRTIDLFRLQQRASTGLPVVEALTEALRGGGGWFEVDSSLNARVHGAEGTHLVVAPH